MVSMQNVKGQIHSDVNVNGGRSLNTVHELINGYEAATEQLRDLLSFDVEPSFEQISRAETVADVAFDALLATDLGSSQEVFIKINFLLSEISNSVEAGSLADRMMKSIEDDLLKMSQRT